MAQTHHTPLFHARLVRERVNALPSDLFERHAPTVRPWLEHLASGRLNETKETSLHGGFLERIFGDLLGYNTMAKAVGGRWELVAEKSTFAGGSADGALGQFSGSTSLVIAPIELKGAAQFLEHAKGRTLTPIQQGWDYANKMPSSLWIIVSNYRETRLYAKSKGLGAYEVFHLDELASEAGLRRFIALLGRDALLGGPTPEQSPLHDMLVSSERTEREITTKLYGDYRDLRARLFEQLRRVHSNIPPAELLGFAQTILDRVLFLAFAEDRGLVPKDTLVRAYTHENPYNPQPIWRNFVGLFHAVDKGNARLGIPGYNGGLFRANEDIDSLELSDEFCEFFKELGEYDFAEEVSVDVLGHVFEQSVSDLEDLRREVEAPESVVSSTGTQKAPTKRKREGIFYTPPFVTEFLVRNTLGLAFKEAWERSSTGWDVAKADQLRCWELYRGELSRMRVLDPACGSGAFLIAAYDALAHEFERCNRAVAELSGKSQQVGLFDLTRTVLNGNLFGVDKNGESVEIARLSLWLKTAERGRALTFLDRNVRQGNSVVSDPMVDPRAFDWGAGRVARSFLEGEVPRGESAESYDARWRDGFDVVLGNPPYVRQELLTEYKEHWKQNFDCFDGTADLFVYFFERGLKLLRPGGRLGFIVSNKWLRGGYAERLRAMFARDYTIETLVDFGHAPVFPDADAFPCILTMRRAAPEPEHAVWVTQYPREELGKELVASYVTSNRFPLAQRALRSEGWSLERPDVQALLEKLRQNGTPLGDYAGVKPYYGIKTGCNEAFLVDQATKERLCREDPRSAELLKKYLRGQDISRWSPQWAGMWMIYAPWQLALADYPAIERHLHLHREALESRAEVKQGRFPWYALSRYASDYVGLFEKPKIYYPDIMWRGDFCLSTTNAYTNNTGYLLPVADTWLLAVLNSPAQWGYLWRTAQHGKDEALRMFGDYVISLPIPNPTQAQREASDAAVKQVCALTTDVHASIAAVLDLLQVEYEVDKPGNALSDFPSLDSESFVREVRKRRKAPLTAAGLKQLRALFEAEAAPIAARRAQILGWERQIAAQVHAAWGLTGADLQLLRETQPPRMPPGW